MLVVGLFEGIPIGVIIFFRKKELKTSVIEFSDKRLFLLSIRTQINIVTSD